MDNRYVSLNEKINGNFTVLGFGFTITEDGFPGKDDFLDHPETADFPHWLECLRPGEKAYKFTSVESGSTGPVDAYAYVTQERTAIPFWDVEIEQLIKASQAMNESLFVTVANSIDWSIRPVEDYLKAVQLALSAGAHLKARHLAMAGGERFSDHAEMQKYTRILAPAKIVKSHLPPDPEGAKDMRWLKEHHDEYRGQWVALLHGELLATASSLKELIQQIGDPRGTNILVTQVY